MPDALQLLRDDHHKVKSLFKQFEDADSKSEKKRICDETLLELEVHATIEEEIFYPAMQKQPDASDVLEEAEEEHHVAKMIMAELSGKPATMRNYDAKYTVLAENVKHHIEEEESMMLPKAAEMGRDKLEALGRQMEERKMQLTQQFKNGGALGRSLATTGVPSSRSANGASGGRTAKRSTNGTTGGAKRKSAAKRGTTGAAAKRTTTARPAAKRAVTAAKRTTARATGSRTTTGTRSATGMTRTRASGGTRSTASGRSTATTRKTATATRTRGQASASRATGSRAATTRRTAATGAGKSTATRKPATRSKR